MENGGGWTLSDRLSAIRFLHLIEGKGDVDGESFRIRASVNSVKKKRGVNQKPKTALEPGNVGKGKGQIEHGNSRRGRSVGRDRAMFPFFYENW